MPVDPSSGNTRLTQPVIMAYPIDQETRIDLSELAIQFWLRKWLLFWIVLLAAAVGIAFLLVAPPVYRAEAVLLPNQPEQGGGIPSEFGGLASLAGLSFGLPADETEAVAVLQSRVFVEDFIRDQNLLPILFSDEWDPINEVWISDHPDDWPDLRDGVKYFVEGIRSVEQDVTTGIIFLSIEWNDPEMASAWVDALVKRINEKMRIRDLSNSKKRLEYLDAELARENLVELRQVISRLIETEIQTMMLANAETEYAFKIIDPSRVPNERIFPRTLPVLLFAILVGGLIGASFVLVMGWTAITRSAVPANDPD